MKYLLSVIFFLKFILYSQIAYPQLFIKMNSGLNFSIKPDSLKYPYINCEAIASYSNDTVWSDVWNQYIYPRVQNDYNETYPKVNFSRSEERRVGKEV